MLNFFICWQVDYVKLSEDLRKKVEIQGGIRVPRFIFYLNVIVYHHYTEKLLFYKKYNGTFLTEVIFARVLSICSGLNKWPCFYDVRLCFVMIA